MAQLLPECSTVGIGEDKDASFRRHPHIEMVYRPPKSCYYSKRHCRLSRFYSWLDSSNYWHIEAENSAFIAVVDVTLA